MGPKVYVRWMRQMAQALKYVSRPVVASQITYIFS